VPNRALTTSGVKAGHLGCPQHEGCLDASARRRCRIGVQTTVGTWTAGRLTLASAVDYEDVYESLAPTKEGISNGAR
jgi:hypothetical protein